jgi:hypothetical protein
MWAVVEPLFQVWQHTIRLTERNDLPLKRQGKTQGELHET